MILDGLTLVEGTKITNLTTNSGSAFPLNQSPGELFYRTDEDKLYTSNGTAWTAVGTGSGGGSGAWGDITGKPTTISGYGITDAVNTSQLGVSSGVATLDSNGLLTPAQIPAIAITDTWVVPNQGTMLSLNAQVGDIAVRSDLTKTFILKESPASTLANWQELAAPTSGVMSVNGMTGVVTITNITGNAGSASNVTWGNVSAKPTTLAGFGIVDGVTSVNGQYGTVTITNIAGNAATASAVTWNNVTSKPTNIAGFGLTDTFVNSVNGLTGAVSITNITGNAATATNATHVPWSGVTGTPNTLAGYGIIDGGAGGSVVFEKTLNQPGILALTTGTMRWYPISAINLTSIRAYVSTPSTGAPVEISLKKNGTSVATRTIAAENNGSTLGVLDITTTAGDYFTLDITTVGTSYAGADLTVQLGYSAV